LIFFSDKSETISVYEYNEYCAEQTISDIFQSEYAQLKSQREKQQWEELRKIAEEARRKKAEEEEIRR
jgi:pyruvoyl-dependent arginine decarboxylase (PvlArgDC)